MAWNYDPTQYEDYDFPMIPEGDHRVRIEEATEKTFRSGNSGYELVLAVSGYHSKLWYYLVLDPSDPKATNQRIGTLFHCFGITDTNMDHYKAWAGHVGGARVKHEEYNGETQAKVRYLLRRSKQDSLPPWQEPGSGSADKSSATPDFAELSDFDDGDLPF